MSYVICYNNITDKWEVDCVTISETRRDQKITNKMIKLIN